MHRRIAAEEGNLCKEWDQEGAWQAVAVLYVKFVRVPLLSRQAQLGSASFAEVGVVAQRRDDTNVIRGRDASI